MKILILDPTTKQVVNVNPTNITTNAETCLIEVGDHIAVLVDDTDTHNIGDTFTATV
jgi:hypothetical protein